MGMFFNPSLLIEPNVSRRSALYFSIFLYFPRTDADCELCGRTYVYTQLNIRQKCKASKWCRALLAFRIHKARNLDLASEFIKVICICMCRRRCCLTHPTYSLYLPTPKFYLRAWRKLHGTLSGKWSTYATNNT